MGKKTRTRVKELLCVIVNRQCYSAKDLARLQARPRRLIELRSSGDNQNACCGGGAASEYTQSSDQRHPREVPPQLRPPTGGIDKRTKIRHSHEEPEVRKRRLTSGRRCKSLLDDARAEPLPPSLRRPGESKQRQRQPAKQRGKTLPPPLKSSKFHEELENYLSHLPFFNKCRYERSAIMKHVSRHKILRGMLKCGRYYIEKDWKNRLDPRTDPDTLLMLQKKDDCKRRKFRADGPINRIVELFMEKVAGWSVSREMLAQNTATQASRMALLWLGPSLAKKMLNELCVVKNPTSVFELKKVTEVEKDFYMINRLSVDVFFGDKEAFYGMLRDYVMSPSLTCKSRVSETCNSGDGCRNTCEELEATGQVTRRVCVHQNMSLSLKPCLVPNCPNFKRPVCEHMYAFIPETIPINSYISMLHFVDRFQRVEDLKGCIFITKPAYLCNGRGINFLFEMEQFEHFYHMLDGRATSRHGVVLQRYVESPRLFDRQKFTIRFFLLIIVLPKRRVVAFIHYGLAIFCVLPYRYVQRQEFPPEEEELEGKAPNLSVPIGQRTIGRVVDRNFDPRVHLSNYYDSKFRDKVKEDLRTGRGVMMRQDEDCAFYLEDVLPFKCLNSTSIYIQMLFAAQCILDYMQPVIQDYPGTFQTVSVDSLIDARNKLWILEAGTKIFSGLLTVAPRQRQMMSAIIQESLGVTIECFYKSHKDLPLYWDYVHKREDYDAFCFAQDFNFFYETDATKRTDHLFQQQRAGDGGGCGGGGRAKRLEERYRDVDAARDLARARKAENQQRKRETLRRQMEYAARVKQKHEEES